MSRDDAALELNEFIAICRDGIKFYEQAGERIDDPHLQGLFANMVQLRKETIAALAPFVEGSGKQVTDSGTTEGAVHRTLATLAAALSDDEATSLISQLEVTEARTLERLHEIVEGHIPEGSRSILAQKLAMFHSMHNQMKTLNEAQS